MAEQPVIVPVVASKRKRPAKASTKQLINNFYPSALEDLNPNWRVGNKRWNQH